MMAGAYLDVETTRDAINANNKLLDGDLVNESSVAAALTGRLTKAGLTAQQSAALTNAVQHDRSALRGLLIALQGAPDVPLNPWEQAFWMLAADFLAAAVPILPFVFLPIAHARLASGLMTLALLVGLGIGRARIAKRSVTRTVAETVTIGVAAALAGVLVGVLINNGFGI
jgi:vacuolar iron transporter family protein